MRPFSLSLSLSLRFLDRTQREHQECEGNMYFFGLLDVPLDCDPDGGNLCKGGREKS